MAVSLPTDGTEYPMMLGSSFHAGQPEQSDLCLLHYSFKPASAGRFQKGGIYVQPEQQKVNSLPYHPLPPAPPSPPSYKRTARERESGGGGGERGREGVGGTATVLEAC